MEIFSTSVRVSFLGSQPQSSPKSVWSDNSRQFSFDISWSKLMPECRKQKLCRVLKWTRSSWSSPKRVNGAVSGLVRCLPSKSKKPILLGCTPCMTKSSISFRRRVVLPVPGRSKYAEVFRLRKGHHQIPFVERVCPRLPFQKQRRVSCRR